MTRTFHETLDQLLYGLGLITLGLEGRYQSEVTHLLSQCLSL